MKFIVDEIVPEECPFFIDEEWVEDNGLKINRMKRKLFLMSIFKRIVVG